MPQAGTGDDAGNAHDESGTGAANATGPRISELTGTVDPGSIGTNREFNAIHNLGPWDANYRVMEDDSRMQNLTSADELLLRV